MKLIIFFFILQLTLSYCNKTINFNETSFYFLYYLYENDVLCINSSKSDWSFLINEGVQQSEIKAHYRDISGMKQLVKNSTDFLGFHILGSESSIEIHSRSRIILSFQIVSFDPDCDIRIISNLKFDIISKADWPSPDLTDKKLCYLNGLSFKNHFSRQTISKSLTSFRYNNSSYLPWVSKEIDTESNHPPILELFYDKNSIISVLIDDSSTMNHGRSVLILNSTYRKSTIFKGVPYDPSACQFYDFQSELLQIKEINLAFFSTCVFIVLILIAYIVTYCYCCPCCKLYRPQCLYRFGLKPTDQDNSQNNPNKSESNSQNQSSEGQQPVFYVYQQHVSQTPAIAPQGTTTDGQYQQPLMSLTVNPPPGIYEPVRVSAPIVPVTIVDDDSFA